MTALHPATLLTWIADICALAALAGVAYVLLNIALVLRLRKPTLLPVEPSQVSVLVPLCGAEDGLYERLAALCRQTYARDFEIICGALSAADPALAVAHRAARDFPHARLDVASDDREIGLNRKISNLSNMLTRARYETVVMLDSDIVVDDDYLSRIVAELGQPGVGAVTSLYYGLSGAGIWSSLSSVAINVHFLPNVISGLRLGMATPCFGATIALSRALIEEVGGMSAFAGALHDDYAIGAAVRATGRKVAVSYGAVGHLCLERSAGELWQSQLRRARTIHAIDPIGNLGAAITHPFALALLAMALGAPDGPALVLAVVAARFAQCLCIDRVFGLKERGYWTLPLSDLLSFAAYLIAFIGGDVVWRGARYKVALSGQLLPQVSTDA